MSRVRIQSYVKVGEVFQPIQEIEAFCGDCMYVAGAVSIVIDDVEMMGFDLWDDINWLWPYIAQAVDECRRTGIGKRGFPSQPISFKVETAWPGQVLVSVASESFESRAIAPEDDLYAVVAQAGLTFFAELQRICPGHDNLDAEIDMLRSWQK